MACIAVPEQGEGDHPAFGLADLVVDSLLEVDGSSLDEVARRHAGAPRGLSRPERSGAQSTRSRRAATSR